MPRKIILSDETKNEILKIYASGGSAARVSRKTGVSYKIVLKTLKENDIEIRKRWGKERHTDSHGYYIVRHPETNKYVKEHVLVMENNLGRSIPKGMDVHHIDENKKNNNIKNLQLLNKREHMRIHRLNGENVPCAQCGKIVYRNNYRIEKQKNNYCSRECYYMSMQTLKKTDDEWLELFKKNTTTQLSKDLKISRDIVQSRRNKLVKRGLLKGELKKGIAQLDLSGKLIKEYVSLKEAERETGVKSSGISFVASGKNKQAGGYKWKYTDY